MKKGLGWLTSFLKIGAIGFGGGTSLIPVIENEMVDSKKLLTKEEYDSAVIAASITPGALPVEISAYVGRDIGGIRGMLLAPACMIIPGVLLTVIMLATMDSLDAEVIRQIEIISIGITAFIFSMMTKYITGTMKWAKEKNKTLPVLAVIICVFLLSAGKAAGKILSSFGITWEVLFSISTVHILIMAFFVICYAGSRRDKLSAGISVIICILYIMFQSKAQIMASLIGNELICIVFFRLLQLVMMVLAVYGVVSVRDKSEKPVRVSPKGLIKECAVWFIVLAVACIPAYLMVPELVKYIGNGFLSS
ncbi:MAG: chromate transporter, partial [Firmicutes bacterium]|nr:chromate transporter [Bacillota bacterium]